MASTRLEAVSATAASLVGVYEAQVTHSRQGPAAHGFSAEVAMLLIDVDHPERLLGRHPLYGTDQRLAVRRFERADYLRDRSGSAAAPIRQVVDDLVEAELGEHFGGPVLLLTQLRSAGVQFNPVSCYFCFDEQATSVRAMVLEVTNTPWHERHAYVVGPPGEHVVDKALHVSPFFSMDQSYHIDYAAPAERWSVGIDVVEGEETVMRARLTLSRLGADREALAHAMWHYPAGTLAVSAGIYKQAYRLWRKGAVFYRHPARTSTANPQRTERGRQM